MGKNLISIIVPSLNVSKSIEKAIKSIVQQKLAIYEIIFIDGGSTDDTCNIINQYQEKYPNITLISEKDNGIYDAMNKGIEKSTGEWLYFMGADDELYDENVISDIVSSGLLEKGKVIYGNVKIRGNNEWAKDEQIYDGQFDLKKLLSKNICQQAIFYPKHVFNNYRKFDLRFSIISDWDFNLRCYSKDEFIYLDRIIAYFSTGGKSSENVKEKNYKDFVWNIIDNFKIDLTKAKNYSVDSPYGALLSNFLVERFNLNPNDRSISEGISLFTAVKNRKDILEESLKTWITHKEIDEIIILDWSSNESLVPLIEKYQDGRILLIEVKGKDKWVLSYAFNIAARFTSKNKILKIDGDVKILPDFFNKNKLEPGHFITGSWENSRNENETHLNGNLFINRDDFFSVNGYNEFLTTYGWDDSDLFNRLGNKSLVRDIFDLDTLYHIEHRERMTHQVDSDRFKVISDDEWSRINILKNRYIAIEKCGWSLNNRMLDILKVGHNENFFQVEVSEPKEVLSNEVEEEGILFATKDRLRELFGINRDELDDSFSGNEIIMIYSYYLNTLNESMFEQRILLNNVKNFIDKLKTKNTDSENEIKLLNDLLILKDEVVKKHGEEILNLQYLIDEKDKMLENSARTIKESLNEIKALNEKKSMVEEERIRERLNWGIEIEEKSRTINSLNNDVIAFRNSITFKILKLTSLILLLFKPVIIIKKFKGVYNLQRNYRILKRSNLFDEVYYLSVNKDVASLKHNPVKHYLLHGSKEGRDPSRMFNNNFYLERYPDVRENGINPLLHYILHGQKEGRITLNPVIVEREHKKVIDNDLAEKKTEDSNNKIDYEVRLIKESGMFDYDYYLKQYPDILEAGIDPVFHYHSFGWREKRKPNPDFNTSYYLFSNPDIVSANIDPFYHYIVAGQFEGRAISHPCEVKVDRLKQAYNEKNIVNEIINDEESDEIKKIEDCLHKSKSGNNKRIVVSISHDDYIENIGGIQLCIVEEQKAFTDNGYIYIHISPNNIKMDEYDPLKTSLLRVIIDGEKIGYFNSEELVNAFNYGFKGSEPILIVHSIINNNKRFLLRVSKEIEYSRKFFWIHDHSTICTGYTLLRNNVEYCNAPEIQSNACRLCVFDELRNKLQKFTSIYFVENEFEIIAPSEFALNFWKSKSQLPYKASYVLSHANFHEGVESFEEMKNEKIKIAYIGIPAYHKGWNEFESLVRKFGDDNRYYFLHIGMFPTENKKIHFYESKLTKVNPNLMVENINKHQPHFCFIWPKVTETFSFVTFEAIAAGSEIITNNRSGNVKDLVLKMDKGIVYESIDKLNEDFEQGFLIDYVNKKNAGKMLYPNYERSKMTYTFLNNDES